jgi:hypothetical protein
MTNLDTQLVRAPHHVTNDHGANLFKARALTQSRQSDQTLSIIIQELGRFEM